ncbi:hypothetical protein BKA62DRAFT_817595 [Auriculariales sp. MPI-PUGE-AT-0066]|nr:hypothetical protein BKA62DRAFT_817595 [Auriculariales sp. MPI-PUGE-AT-0066]
MSTGTSRTPLRPTLMKRLALTHGYSTLSYDNLGNGEGSPNPFNLAALSKLFMVYRHLGPPTYTPTVACSVIQIALQAFSNRSASVSDGYVVITNRSVFYSPPGLYEGAAVAHDATMQKLFTVMDAFTADRGFVATLAFHGHVLAVAGEQDAKFCVQQPPGAPSCLNKTPLLRP